jgi:outer membrane protein
MTVLIPAILLTALTGAQTALAGEIGYVDMQRVLEESELGKAAQAALEERFGDDQQAFAREEAEIRQLQQTLERDRPLMSEAQLEKKETEIQERIKKFEQDFAQIQQQLMQAQQQEGTKILPAARDAVMSVAKKKEISAVFEANQAGLVYLDEDGDITADVIKAMNAQTD